MTLLLSFIGVVIVTIIITIAVYNFRRAEKENRLIEYYQEATDSLHIKIVQLEAEISRLKEELEKASKPEVLSETESRSLLKWISNPR